MQKGFNCSHCQKFVAVDSFIGTHFRNHCPFCLWSSHVDFKKSGDRSSQCHGDMEPIGLTFKQEGYDKYGKKKQGELMLIHHCLYCDELSINRIAGDDSPTIITKVFKDSLNLTRELKDRLKQEKIDLLTKKDKKEIDIQLFGKNKQSTP